MMRIMITFLPWSHFSRVWAMGTTKSSVSRMAAINYISWYASLRHRMQEFVDAFGQNSRQLPATTGSEALPALIWTQTHEARKLQELNFWIPSSCSNVDWIYQCHWWADLPMWTPWCNPQRITSRFRIYSQLHPQDFESTVSFITGNFGVISIEVDTLLLCHESQLDRFCKNTIAYANVNPTVSSTASNDTPQTVDLQVGFTAYFTHLELQKRISQ